MSRAEVVLRRAFERVHQVSVPKASTPSQVSGARFRPTCTRCGGRKRLIGASGLPTEKCAKCFKFFPLESAEVVKASASRKNRPRRDVHAPFVETFSPLVLVARLPMSQQVALDGYFDGETPGIPGALRQLRRKGFDPPRGRYSFRWAQELVTTGIDAVQTWLDEEAEQIDDLEGDS